ncbi:uncharacterized protein I303_102939 [Kwoniella dejecticola CBS 10117]|uniref:Protein kinase domain-containing protein n=1 Tax=Kwoniella dejecticola CBS 10117 TaxID=1296121 RepID=A0A1A6AA55_9TREE|nr:uncharacterized protein I303_02958 [Kwoniella dejecticola CBS 10117]OBR86937.1 hypothetical protein I303_02958 [Kwoniella dejecticola CBS 10117]
MSFEIRFANGIEPNLCSKLIGGLHFTPHPKSHYTENVEGTRLDDPTDAHRQEEFAAGFNSEILLITKHMNSGYLWDFWLADHPRYGRVIFKVFYRPEYPCRIPHLYEYIPSKKLFDELVKEENFYLRQLSTLQGNLVPKYYGMYTSGKKDRYLAMLLEYAGQSLGSRYIELNREYTEKIYDAYERLHLHGVMQFDIDGRQNLIDEEGRVRLVGFRRAESVNLRSPKGVDRIIGEAWCIRRRFGGRQDMNFRPTGLPDRYWNHLADSAGYKAKMEEKERLRLWHSPAMRAYNEKLGIVYDENGFVISEHGLPPDVMRVGGEEAPPECHNT